MITWRFLGGGKRQVSCIEKLKGHAADRKDRGRGLLHAGLLRPCPQSAWPLLHRPRKNPLFIVDLVLDSSGVHYSTPLEQFEASLLSLFDKGILATHAVPHLEKVQAQLEARGTCCPGFWWPPEVLERLGFILGLPPGFSVLSPLILE